MDKMKQRRFSFLLLCWFLACGFPITSIASPEIPYVDLPACSLNIVNMQSYVTIEARAAFAQAYPRIALKEANISFLTDAAYIDYLLTRDSSVDIYCLPVNIGVGNLKDKGYLPSLESSFANKMISTYYPQLQQLLASSGNVVAVPAYFAALPWYRNTVLWEQVDAGPVPSNYVEYAALVRWWEEEHMEKEEFNLSINSQSRDNLLTEMMQIYLLQTERRDAPVNFDTPSFREALSTVASMPVLQQRHDPNDEWLNEMVNLPSLIDQGYGELGQTPSMPDWSPMIPLVVEKDLPVALPVQMSLYVLNPYSKNLSAARKYLEYVLAYLPPAYKIQFSPQENTPLQDPRWEQVKASRQEKITRLQAQLEKAVPEEAKGLEEQITSIQNNIEREEGRTLISKKDIQEYREIAPYMHFGEYSIILNYGDAAAFKELMVIATRYCEGNLDLETAVRELNAKAKTIFLEAL